MFKGHIIIQAEKKCPCASAFKSVLKLEQFTLI